MLCYPGTDSFPLLLGLPLTIALFPIPSRQHVGLWRKTSCIHTTLTQICIYTRGQLCHLDALRLPAQLWWLKMACLAFLSCWRAGLQGVFCSCLPSFSQPAVCSLLRAGLQLQTVFVRNALPENSRLCCD